jgi:hypothetical protein
MIICSRAGAADRQFVCFDPSLRAGCPTHLAFASCWEVRLSWRATAHVKPLTKHQDGTPLTAREKLILFVLADSHNDEFDCAWLGITKASAAALTSRSRFIELLKRLETKGTIHIERREGQTHRYHFPNLPVRESDPPKKSPVLKSDPTRPIATGPHPSDSCRTQASIEPLVTDIQPMSGPVRTREEIFEEVRRKEQEAKERFRQQYPSLAAKP